MELSGKTFKKIREQKGFSVAETVEGICSQQFLRKYEAEKSDISLTNVLLLLNRLNVTMDEFLSECANDSFDNFFPTFEKQSEQILHSHDSFKYIKAIEELETLYLRTKEEKYAFLVSILKDEYNKTFQESFLVDWEPTIQYLQKVEQWDRFEFYLCEYSRFPLSDYEMYQYTLKGIKRHRYTSQTILYVCDFAAHLANHFINQNKFDLAKKLIQTYFDFHFEENYLNHLVFDIYFQFLKGIILIKEGHESEGKRICQSVISLLAKVGFHSGYVSNMNNHYIKILNQLETKE